MNTMDPNNPEESTTLPESDVETTTSAPEVLTEQKLIPISQLVIGLVFLSISVGSGAVLIGALTKGDETPPVAQVAAVEARIQDIYGPLSLEARGVYVYDAKNEKELFSKGGALQLPLASITKVALVLTIAEVLPPESVVTISRTAVEKGGGGLTWGEEWLVRDLIDYTLITSSNTGAEALREAADPLLSARYPEAGIENATIWRMNSLAQQLGMNETYFINATGLDESPTQAGALSSPRDVAALFAYALRTHRELFSVTSKTEIPLGPSNAPERDARNTNAALFAIPNIIMGKTGTTDLAGGNLAVAFDAEPGHPFIIVVLGSGIAGRFEDVEKLVKATRENLEE